MEQITYQLSNGVTQTKILVDKSFYNSLVTKDSPIGKAIESAKKGDASEFEIFGGGTMQLAIVDIVPLQIVK